MGVTAEARRAWHSRRKPLSRWLGPTAGLVIRCFVAVVFLLPFYFVIVTSLKQQSHIFTDPPEWIPNPVMWRNYALALSPTYFPFFTFLRNTLFYVCLTTAGTVCSSLFIAYGFARIDFWGRGVLFTITLATMMLPHIVTLIPTYLLFRWFHLVGGYAPLIIPAWFGSAFNIFLLRQFLMGIPWDLTDAALVDGANESYILLRIMVPLVKPALLIVSVLQILGAWNDFMGPLIYLDNSSQYPLVLGLSSFQNQHGIEWNLTMCASLATTLPLIVLFFLAQRYFIEGIVLTGLKA